MKFYVLCEAESNFIYTAQKLNSTPIFLLIYDSLSFKQQAAIFHEPIFGFHPVATVYVFIYYSLLICLDTWQGKYLPYVTVYLHISILMLKLKCFQVL